VEIASTNQGVEPHKDSNRASLEKMATLRTGSNIGGAIEEEPEITGEESSEKEDIVEEVPHAEAVQELVPNPLIGSESIDVSHYTVERGTPKNKSVAKEGTEHRSHGKHEVIEEESPERIHHSARKSIPKVVASETESSQSDKSEVEEVGGTEQFEPEITKQLKTDSENEIELGNESEPEHRNESEHEIINENEIENEGELEIENERREDLGEPMQEEPNPHSNVSDFLNL